MQRALDVEWKCAKNHEYDHRGIVELQEQLPRVEDVEIEHLIRALTESYAKDGTKAPEVHA